MRLKVLPHALETGGRALVQNLADGSGSNLGGFGMRRCPRERSRREGGYLALESLTQPVWNLADRSGTRKTLLKEVGKKLAEGSKFFLNSTSNAEVGYSSAESMFCSRWSVKTHAEAT